MASFAAAFPDMFAGQVVGQYSYKVPPQGFYRRLGSSVRLGNARYSFESGALEYDLKRTEGVPTIVMQSVRRYQERRTAEGWVAVGAGGIAFVMMLVIPLFLIGPEDEYAPPAAVAVLGGSVLVFAVVALDTCLRSAHS